MAEEATSASNEAGDAKQQHQKWFPLESNPALMNQYMSSMGWDVDQYHIVDVFSTEEWALEMIPQPVAAVLLLYPLTAVQLQHEKEEQLSLVSNPTPPSNDIWFTKQRIGNACGTIGLLHAMLNVPNVIQYSLPQPVIRLDSWLQSFASATNTSAGAADDPITPLRRAEILESDNVIATLHDAAASSQENQTARGNLDDDVITHFIALVCQHGTLYELDGRKGQPIAHGATSTSTLLADACRVIQEQFMARDPNELRFTILALAPNRDDDME
jgi:ubiquitin carboxyl-terminal hydrolase L3